jgi:hypothetical protein
MNTLRILFFVLITAAFAAGQTKPASRPADETVKIWEQGEWKGELPGGWKIEGPEKSEVTPHMGGTTAVKNISVPLLEYFKPAAEKAARRAIIVCPGGGYNILAWDLEGTEVAALAEQPRLPRLRVEVPASEGK